MDIKETKQKKHTKIHGLLFRQRHCQSEGLADAKADSELLCRLTSTSPVVSHCDRTGEREKNALPAIRVVLHAHFQEFQITANIMKPLAALRISFNILQVNQCLGHNLARQSLGSGPGSTVSYHPGNGAADEHPMAMDRACLTYNCCMFLSHPLSQTSDSDFCQESFMNVL